MTVKPVHAISVGGVLLAAGLMFGAAASYFGVRLLMGFGFNFYEKFQTIDVGMSETQVVTLLGAADETSETFRLGQRDGFEREYALAAQSESTHFLLWHKGIDVVYAVGVDEKGQVTMKAVGGT